MKRIVDSSVALKWFVIEPDHEAAKAMIGQALVAPDLLLAEIANASRKKCRAGAMTAEQAQLALAMVGSFVELVPSPPLVTQALAIALDIGHAVYDCVFLALCEQSGLELVTADHRLVTRCHGTRFETMLVKLA